MDLNWGDTRNLTKLYKVRGTLCAALRRALDRPKNVANNSYIRLTRAAMT